MVHTRWLMRSSPTPRCCALRLMHLAASAKQCDVAARSTIVSCCSRLSASEPVRCEQLAVPLQRQLLQGCWHLAEHLGVRKDLGGQGPAQSQVVPEVAQVLFLVTADPGLLQRHSQGKVLVRGPDLQRFVEVQVVPHDVLQRRRQDRQGHWRNTLNNENPKYGPGSRRRSRSHTARYVSSRVDLGR